MANPSWPTDLPQQIFTDQGPECDPVSNVIRSPMTNGPAKLRRRFTAVTEDVTGNLELCETELAILKEFVQVTLGETGRFDWIDFTTGEAAVYRFKDGWASVKKKWFAGDVWTVSLELEMMP